MAWAAVVLTGGTASRLDGADKAALRHDGTTLLERALAAVAGADETVVVGPGVPTSRPVAFTRESPPGGGPLAGLAAGVAALAGEADVVVVLAVDMPHVTSHTVARLLDALTDDADGAWLVDGGGRRQLAGAVRRSAVPPAAAAYGAPMRLLTERPGQVDVPARGAEADDVDTPADLDRLRDEGHDTTSEGERT